MLKECQPARLNADMVKLFAYAIHRDGMQAGHQSADLVSAENFLILIQTKTSLHTIGRQVAITRRYCPALATTPLAPSALPPSLLAWPKKHAQKAIV